MGTPAPAGEDGTGGFISGKGGTTPTPAPAVDISEGRIRTPLGTAPFLAVALIAAGFYLMWFGVHYWRSSVKWPSDPIKALLTGNAPPAADAAPPAAAQIAVASATEGDPITPGQPTGSYVSFAASWHAKGVDTPSNNQALGQQMAAGSGWTGAEWQALQQLWSKCSGWQTTFTDAKTGAYGIPAALPPAAMASAGADWQTNPATQIVYGLGYVRQRYQTPSAAWAHMITAGSY